MTDQTRFWIGFNLVKGIGAMRLQALITHFGDVEAAWRGSPDDLRAAGLGAKLVERLVQVRAGLDLDRVWERIQADGIQVLTWPNPAYPTHLREIDQPPPVLYVRGELLNEDELAVALVGTRQVSPYGRQVTEAIAVTLVQNGVTVVSGLARGVDAVAHQAALQAGGRTLAVLGSGVDRVYPPEHRALAERIVAHGALVSDYPPGTAPDSANFPARNRIISGLSLAVVVTEAGQTSGALLTAAFAADQGRDVFAVPGSILAANSRGTNSLIVDGARPLLDARDVLEALDLGRASVQRDARRALPPDPTEARVLASLGQEPLHIDEIRVRSGLPVEQVSAVLVMMELKGLVRQVGGMNYVSLREDELLYNVGTLNKDGPSGS